MILAKKARLIGGFIVAMFIIWEWYSVAADYDYDALSGTYTFSASGETSTLILRKDRTFQQELTHAGKVDHAEGRWHRSGEGGIEFTKEFLKVSGQEVTPDGEADGEVKKRFLGLFPSIRFNPRPGGPRFYKKAFS